MADLHCAPASSTSAPRWQILKHCQKSCPALGVRWMPNCGLSDLILKVERYMDYDVIIVGARVAGSVLAALLGGQGHRVLLLEKAHFPSDTLSTHFFRAPA